MVGGTPRGAARRSRVPWRPCIERIARHAGAHIATQGRVRRTRLHQFSLRRPRHSLRRLSFWRCTTATNDRGDSTRGIRADRLSNTFRIDARAHTRSAPTARWSRPDPHEFEPDPHAVNPNCEVNPTRVRGKTTCALTQIHESAMGSFDRSPPPRNAVRDAGCTNHTLPQTDPPGRTWTHGHETGSTHRRNDPCIDGSR